jgi:predicted Zn-dependent protease
MGIFRILAVHRAHAFIRYSWLNSGDPAVRWRVPAARMCSIEVPAWATALSRGLPRYRSRKAVFEMTGTRHTGAGNRLTLLVTSMNSGRLLSYLIAASLSLTLIGAAFARDDNEGVVVRRPSVTRKLVSEETLEAHALRQYRGMLQAAQSKAALLPKEHPQVVRLHAISQKIIPHATKWNEQANGWKWEVNVIGSQQINAFCMPGGKIAFFLGILDKLELTDNEVAMVMGHEMAHALREHARARLAKTRLTGLGAQALSSLLGLGDLGQAGLSAGAQLLTLKFSRGDESEADLIGMELAARAGYDPRAGITLWQKMTAAAKRAPPQWLSTHPASGKRVADMNLQIDRVLPLYAHATNRDLSTLPPYRSNLEALRRLQSQRRE